MQETVVLDDTGIANYTHPIPTDPIAVMDIAGDYLRDDIWYILDNLRDPTFMTKMIHDYEYIYGKLANPAVGVATRATVHTHALNIPVLTTSFLTHNSTFRNVLALCTHAKSIIERIRHSIRGQILVQQGEKMCLNIGDPARVIHLVETYFCLYRFATMYSNRTDLHPYNRVALSCIRGTGPPEKDALNRILIMKYENPRNTSKLFTNI
jgi:hypothetical protein